MSSRRESLRILFIIAFRNLLASPVRTTILGSIILVGSLVVVLGTSILDSIDSGVRTSVQGSLGGHLQVYDGRSEDELALYGGMGGEPRLEPIEDFGKVKKVLLGVPNVKQVVPMGIHQAMVAAGNVFDLALERLRGDVRRLEGGEESPALEASYEAHRLHLKYMTGLLKDQLSQARAIADLHGREAADQAREWNDLNRAADPTFWDEFDRDRYGNLEFLENRIAPLELDSAFVFLRYVGTDPQAFFRAFPLAEISKGEMIPPGRRGLLVGEQYADEWLKLKNARRLDLLKDARERLGRKIARDEEMQRWVRENLTGLREILLQLDPVRSGDVAADLRKGLGAGANDSLRDLLAKLFSTGDGDFDEKYRLFYEVVAPRLSLYKINVGDTITIKAPTKSGYFSSVNAKVYGFIRFKGIERSNIAGMISILDIESFRTLYGFLTPEKRAEIDRMKAQLGAEDVNRDDAEAALFGSANAQLAGSTRAGDIDDDKLLRKESAASKEEERPYTEQDVEHGVAINAAIILEQPSRMEETKAAIEKALDQAGLGYHETKGPDGEVTKSGIRVIDWQAASGIVGLFVKLIRIVLFTAILIFFSIALVIINNAMVMATLQRVKEIGTLRAIGTQKSFVVLLMVVEIATVGLLFGLAGALLGGIGVWGIRAVGGIPATSNMMFFLFSGPALMPRLGALAVGTSLSIVLLVSILSALYPALLAMRVTPVEAMATED